MAERPAPRGHRDDPAYSLFRNIPCRSPGCNRWFCNNAGLTKHMRAKHSFVRLQERPIPHPWELNDFPNPHLKTLMAQQMKVTPLRKERLNCASGSTIRYCAVRIIFYLLD